MIAHEAPMSVDLVSVEWSPPHSAWLVIWAGYVHGGCHYRREDADVHAAALLEDPEWETWQAMHQYGAGEDGPVIGALNVITAADIAAAREIANSADVVVAAAWDAVEQATCRALALEAEANHLHAIAARLTLQLGFRRV